MNRQPYLESKKLSALLFAGCFAVYSASYVGRINLSAAIADRVAAGLFTKEEAGLIGTVFFVVYGSFQIINGVLGDKISPFGMIIAGTFGGAVANAGMAFCSTHTQMAVVWGVNGLAMSLLWVAILKILANIINDDMRQRACLNLSATLPVGSVLAYLLSAFSLKFLSWQFVFLIPAGILFAVAVFFTLSYRAAKPHITMREVPLPEKVGAKGAKSGKLLPLFAVSGLLLVLPADVIHGAIKEGITTWEPTMIAQVFNKSVSLSTLSSVLLPVFNLTGIYLITPIYKKLCKSNELVTGTLIVAFSSVVLLALTFLLKSGVLPLGGAVVMLSTVTMAMGTFNYMIITCVPMRFAALGKTATVSGVMNATAYVGCAFASAGFGSISEKYGWVACVAVWAALALAGVALTAVAALRWKKFIARDDTAAAERS